MAISNYQGGGDSVIFQNFKGVLDIMQNNNKMNNARQQEALKQRDKLSSEISKDMSKLNSAGIREIDLPEFNKAMEGAREKFFELGRARTREEAQLKNMQVNEHFNEAIRIKEMSKATADRFIKSDETLLRSFGKMDDKKAREYLTGLKNKKSTEIGETDFDLGRFMFQWDDEKLEKTIKDLANTSLKNPEFATTSRGVGKEAFKVGEKTYYDIETTKSVGEEKRFELLSQLYQTDRNFQNKVQSMMDEGMPLNDALNTISEQYSRYFTEYKEEMKSGDKGSININNNNQLPDNILGKQKSLKLGGIDTNKAWSFNKSVGLQGEVDFYDTNGNKIDQSRSTVQFDGYNIAVLPVDSEGRPIMKGSNRKAVGEGTFMTGRVMKLDVAISERALRENAREFLKRDVVIPYNELDYITMPKRQTEIVTGVSNQANNKQAPKQGTNVSSRINNDPLKSSNKTNTPYTGVVGLPEKGF